MTPIPIPSLNVNQLGPNKADAALMFAPINEDGTGIQPPYAMSVPAAKLVQINSGLPDTGHNDPDVMANPGAEALPGAVTTWLAATEVLTPDVVELIATDAI